MDNVTHTLFALTLARTRLGKAGRGATAALVIASSAPDIDVITTADSALSYLAWHRGPTHGPLGIIGLGLATAAVVWMGAKYLDSRRRAPADARQHVSIGRLAVVSIVGVFLHVAMDAATPYGTRALSPFGWQWIATDWMPIVDLCLLAILIGGLLLGRDAAGRTRNVTIVLALVAANYGVHAAAHQRALAAVPRVFGPLPSPCPGAHRAGELSSWGRDWNLGVRTDSTDSCLVDVAALPTFLAPFRWKLVARLSDAYLIQEIDLLERQAPSNADPRSHFNSTIRIPTERAPAVEQASRARVAQVFLDFSRFPAAQLVEDEVPDGTATVRWTDMRFADASTSAPSAAATARRNVFTATVRTARDGRILEERLGP